MHIRERKVCQPKCARKSLAVEINSATDNLVERIGCDCRSDNNIETVIVETPKLLCSSVVQCSFCRWKRHRRSVSEGGAGVSCDRGEQHRDNQLDPAGRPPGMDTEDEWCGRLIRDQHGLYGKLTPVFRQHFNNRQKEQLESETAILDSDESLVDAGDARGVVMETACSEAAAKLSGMSLAERRLSVAPRITLTSVDGEDHESGGRQQQQQRSSGDAMPCRSAGLDSAGGQCSPLSPNFLSVPQLQEVGKERRPAPMVV